MAWFGPRLPLSSLPVAAQGAGLDGVRERLLDIGGVAARQWPRPGDPTVRAGGLPLIVHSSLTAEIIRILYENDHYGFVSEVLDAVGWIQTSCPFVFAIASPGIGTAGGRKFNYGYNNGGGVAVFDFDDVRASDEGDPWTNPGRHFQFTLLHELGHAFGPPHTFDYCFIPRYNDDQNNCIPSHSEANMNH